jgi:signal peptidase II
MIRARLPYLAVLLGVIALDQLTKWLVVRSLPLHDYRPVVDGFLSLSHVRNRGAAFGILSDADLPYQPVLFALLSGAALLVIGIYAWRLPGTSAWPRYALSLVLGGALGNLLDRVRLGYVVDFVHVYWKQYQWPDFNVADSAITVGVALLILDIVRSPRPADAAEPPLPEAAPSAGRTD